LAAISPDYYARIEQGRRLAAPKVLDAIADVLQLDETSRAYVLELAGHSVDTAPGATQPTARDPHPVLERILADLRWPAIILGRRMDVLAWNDAASRLLLDFAGVPRARRNYVHLLFTDPRMRELYRDWEDFAAGCVAVLRREAALNPDDQLLSGLVGELSRRDEFFLRSWAGHHVATNLCGTKRLHHPEVGNLELTWDTVMANAEDDQGLVVWSAPDGSPSQAALTHLLS